MEGTFEELASGSMIDRSAHDTSQFENSRRKLYALLVECWIWYAQGRRRRQVRWCCSSSCRSWSSEKFQTLRRFRRVRLHSRGPSVLPNSPHEFGLFSPSPPPLTTTGQFQPTRQNGTSSMVTIDATVHLENEALIQCRFATEQPASTAQSLLARAAATSASLSRTPVRLPRPSTAGSSSAPSPTSEMS